MKIALIFAFIAVFSGFGVNVYAAVSSTPQNATSTPIQTVIGGIGTIFETLARWGSKINFTDIAEWFKQTTGKTFSEAFDILKNFLFKAVELGTQAVQWIINKLGFRI